MNGATLTLGLTGFMVLAGVAPRGAAAKGKVKNKAKIKPRLDMPSKKEMKPYVSDCECYEYAQWMANDFGFRRAIGGYFFNGKLRDHAWVVMPDGTILDSTHGQFVPREKIRIAKPGTAKHQVYVEDVHMTEAQLLETFGPP